jgi:long-chain acyl-CoA synthetase
MATDFKSLPDLFEASIARFGDNPLFGTKQSDGTWAWMSYAEFGERVARARAGLAGLGVGSGDRVAVILDNSTEWAVGAYGTYTLGAAWVPMYEAQQSKEWQYILADSGAKVAFVADDGTRAQLEDHADRLPDLEQVVVIHGEAEGAAITFDELLARGAEAPVDTVHPDPESLAGLIYTSGTTGNPKGVMLSHANLTSNINTYPDLFDIGPDDRTASFLPWAHSFGQVVELHFILAAGASAGLTSAKTLMDDLPEIKPTILVSVPAVYNRIYDGLKKLMAAEGGIKKMMFDQAMSNADKRSTLAAEGKTSTFVELQQGLFDQLVFSKVRDRFGGRLKYAFSGGAAISPEVAEFISALGLTVYEGYGLTETSPVAAANIEGSRKVGTVGREIPGVRIDIDMDAVGSEEVGEIVIHGPNVMMGYYNLPEENEAAFTPDGGFRSGDLGSRDDEGFISIRGRIKEQYKLENGKYVVPSPIEEQLQLSGFVTNIMVYGEQRPHNVAVIVPDIEALKAWADDNGLGDRSTGQLLKEEKVADLIQLELNRQSGPIKGYEKIRGFVLTDEEFTPENGMLTPSLKIKRRAIMAKYSDEIEALYQK